MEFRLLGPLEVRGTQEAYEPPAGKERALLAILLLRANQPVSSDELVAELWGGSPPTKPGKNVQSYISRLRRRLGDDRIATTPAGYVIRVEPDELDVDRFERLAAEGAAKLAAGETAGARNSLAEALALWSGPALADFRFDSFAQAEIRRLESLRDSATADRIDAVLARSPARVIPELESLVASKPLWERPRAQLMLALYRAGRQSEALDLYRDARTLLGDELGIEPSPELQQLQRAILNQDPTLIPPSLPADDRARTRRRSRGLIAVTAGLLAVAVAGAAVVALESGPDPTRTVKPDSVALLDPASGKVIAQTPVAGSPSQLAVAGGRIWVWGEDSRAISELDSSTLSLRRQLAPGGFADELASGRGGLWMLDSDVRTLIEVDPGYAKVKAHATIPPPRAETELGASQVTPGEVLTAVRAAFTARDAWVTDGGTGVDEIDISGLRPRLVRRIDLGAPLDGIAAGEGAVWVLSGAKASVFELNPTTGKQRTRILLESKPSLGAPFGVGIATGFGSVWVLEGNAPAVARIAPGDGSVTATIPLPIDSDPAAFAAGAGAVWVADSGDGLVSRIDPASNAAGSIHVGGAPETVAASGRTVVVGVQPSLGNASVAPAATLSAVEAAALGALPTSFCSPVYYDGRHLPRLLIAADLPLQGEGNLALTLQMSDAIRYELARAAYRAGPYPIGYQLCDDSTAQYDAWTAATCTRNAKAFAAAPRVVGILGPFNSGCAEEEIPIAEASRTGPLPLISSTATYVGLTRNGPGTWHDEPGVYYPRSVRNFVRVVANDLTQGDADGVVAGKLGVRSLYLLGDGTPYGTGLDASVGNEARRLGIQLAGVSTWGSRSSSAALHTLAREIERTGADGVFIGGTVDESGDALLTALRDVLGPGEKIITPDGFTPIPALLQAGPAAEGVTISIAESDPDHLTGAGAAFTSGFGAAVGTGVQPYSTSAAQATDTLLAAIARSDGTRASVNARLRAVRTTGGILGTFRFDANGDTTAGIVTVYRIENGRAVVWQVLTPN